MNVLWTSSRVYWPGVGLRILYYAIAFVDRRGDGGETVRFPIRLYTIFSNSHRRSFDDAETNYCHDQTANATEIRFERSIYNDRRTP